MPLTEAERKFCELMEADSCVRWGLLQRLKVKAPRLASEVERLLAQYEDTAVAEETPLRRCPPD